MGSNITLALGCGYDCSRIFPGATLQVYNGSTSYLGSTGVMANNVVPNPLAAGATSATFPNIGLDTTVYINVTVTCWPAGFSGLVRRGPPSVLSDVTRCLGCRRWGYLLSTCMHSPATPARASDPEESLRLATAWPSGRHQQQARHMWQAKASNPLMPCP